MCRNAGRLSSLVLTEDRIYRRKPCKFLSGTCSIDRLVIPLSSFCILYTIQRTGQICKYVSESLSVMETYPELALRSPTGWSCSSLYRLNRYRYCLQLIFGERRSMQCDRNNVIHAFNWHEMEFVENFLRHVIQVFHVPFRKNESLNAGTVGRQDLLFDAPNWQDTTAQGNFSSHSNITVGSTFCQCRDQSGCHRNTG